ncbi:MAG TPA: GNAT family protein, partial [Actinoallomurus sp.]|nr:GNAT family protein [Actinoallomurus sp.]
HAPVLTRLYRENRTFLQKWEPERDGAFFSVGEQQRLLVDAARRRSEGAQWTALIYSTTAREYLGYMALNHIVWGALRAGRIGYWVAERECGRGVATAAVARCLGIAFGELGLHRVEASVRTDNPASMKVLENNGFRRIGLARSHVWLHGEWHDEWLYERHEPDVTGPAVTPVR